VAIVPSRLGQALLDSTPTLVYEVPATKLSATIRSISAGNNIAGTVLLSVWLVPLGSSPDDSTSIAKNLVIPAGGVAQDDAVHVLMKGGRVYGQAGVLGDITLTVDGAENS
jgi:hypothetical protein